MPSTDANDITRKFRLIRISYLEKLTFGVLLDNKTPFCVTLEQPWIENRRNVSCIPEGQYACKRVYSRKFGDTFEVMDVPERSHILFHKGNLADDTHGCILVGEQYEPLGGENAVLASGKAFREFKDRTKDIDRFILSIESHKYKGG